MNLRTLFYYKDQFLLLIQKYYYKYDCLLTYLSHFISSVLFGSLLFTIVHLLLQINAQRNMRTRLFCVACALPVFIIQYINISFLFHVGISFIQF